MTIVKQVDGQQEFDDYLNGRVLGGALPTKVFGLHGLTLIINDGSDRTITFADAANEGLSPLQILNKITTDEATLDGDIGLRNYNHSASYKSPAPSLILLTAGQVVKDTGTANLILGFNVNPAGDQTVTAIAQANIISILAGNPGGMFTVIHV